MRWLRALPTRARGALPAIVCLVLAGCVLAGPARAQESTPVSTYKAPWDTTGAAAESLRVATEVADSLAKLTNPFAAPPRDTTGAAFHYTTNYNINRNLSSWSQNLNVDARWHFLHIDNQTSVGFREDAQRHQRSGTRKSNLKLNYVGEHAFTIGAVLDLERDNDGPVVGGRLQPTSSLGNTSARFTLGDSLYLSEVSFFDFGAEGGTLGRDENTGVRRNSSGSDMIEHAAWTFIPQGPFQFQLSGSNNTGRNTGQGSGQRPGPDGTIVNYDTTTTNRNHARNLNGQVRFSVPWHVVQAQVTVAHINSQQQQPTLGQQETLTQNTDNVDGTLSAKVVENLKLNLTVHADSNVVLSDVDASRNYNTRTANGTVGFNYEGWRLGTLNASLATRKSTNDFRKRLSGNLQQVLDHELTTSYHRALGEHFDLQLNASAKLTRTRYDDVVASRQNQDYLNRRLGGSLNFTPKDFPVTMNFQASQVLTHFVFLDGSQSSKNTADQLYSVEYDIAYHHGGGLRLTETYLVAADAGISDFENYPGIVADNRYTKTTSYITSIEEPLTPKVTLNVNHNLRLTGTGSYDLDPFSGQRLFGQSGRTQSNDLTAKMSYRLAQWASAFISDRAEFVHQDAFDAFGNTKPTSRERLLEFNAGLNLTYSFSRWARLDGNFSRSTRLDRLTNYVDGEPSPPRNNNQDFFLITASFDLKF